MIVDGVDSPKGTSPSPAATRRARCLASRWQHMAEMDAIRALTWLLPPYK